MWQFCPWKSCEKDKCTVGRSPWFFLCRIEGAIKQEDTKAARSFAVMIDQISNLVFDLRTSDVL